MTGDLADDVGRIGRWQYEQHRELLDRWARDYPNSIVTGHSLGAALGQRFIADNPGAISGGVFFNAPGVDHETAERFHATTGGTGQPARPTINYFQSLHDFVSEFGGEEHLRGNVVVASGGAVDPGFQGSPGGYIPGSKALAQHRGWMLQSGRSDTSPDRRSSFTTLTPVAFDTYERNRQRNNPSGLLGLNPLVNIPGVKLLGEVADTLVNRSYMPTTGVEIYNFVFSRQRYAEDFSQIPFADSFGLNSPEQNPFLTPGWREIANQTSGGGNDNFPPPDVSNTESSVNPQSRQPTGASGAPVFRRSKVPKLPSWYE